MDRKFERLEALNTEFVKDWSEDLLVIRDRLERDLRITGEYMGAYMRDGDPERVLRARQELDVMLPMPASLARHPSADVFGDVPPKVANHMVQYVLVCEGIDHTPLAEVAAAVDNTFYSHMDFHAAVHFPPWKFASAVLVCKNWKVIVTGGATLQDSQASAKYFLLRLFKLIWDKYGLRVWLKYAAPKNRMCPNKIYGSFVDVVGLVDYCAGKTIPVKCVQSQINNATVIPFPSIFPSLSVIFFPRGGVNIMGFVFDQELDLCVDFVSRVVRGFLRPIKGFDHASIPRLIDESRKFRDSIRVGKREAKLKYWKWVCSGKKGDRSRAGRRRGNEEKEGAADGVVDARDV